MKIRSKLVLAGMLALLQGISQAAWLDASGRSLPDTESMRSAGDFGVQLVLTAHEEEFRNAWNSSSTPPKLSAARSVRQGESISALLVFHGCAPNPAGVCDVVADFLVKSPDGHAMPAGGGPVWSAPPMPPRMLQLGRASVTVGFDKSDPVGEYQVVANVKDKVSGRALSVVSRFKVTP